MSQYPNLRAHIRKALLILSISFVMGCGLNNGYGNRQTQTEVRSLIKEAETSSWIITPSKVSAAERLNYVQFVNEAHGWVISDKGLLYETTDGGKTWKQVEIKTTSSDRIDSCFFATDLIGWVIVRNGHESMIVNTNDGGHTWQVQYSTNSSRVDKVRFNNNQEGWAAGGWVIQDYVQKAPSSIIHTTDQGQHWVDVSSKLNVMAAGINITDLSVRSSAEASVLDIDGKVFQTKDSGQTWRQVIALKDELPQTYFGRLGIVGDGRFWFLGGADSTEGMWGVLVREETNGSWQKLRTSAYFSDAVFFQNDEVIACGHTATNDALNHRKEGVILHSIDGGRSWKTVYRVSNTNIESLSAINSKLFYAVSDTGFVYKLQFNS